jgi:hypothetical protein
MPLSDDPLMAVGTSFLGRKPDSAAAAGTEARRLKHLKQETSTKTSMRRDHPT